MGDLELVPVTPENWRDCAALCVDEDQARFVAPVTFYLCLCAYGTVWHPLAITRDGTVVGFCMWAVDDDGSRWIGGLLVDIEHQRTGVGRQAVQALIERFESEPGCTGTALSYSPDNTVARALYASLGFQETGETEGDGTELVARRPTTASS